MKGHPFSLPWGFNKEIAKIHWRNLKIVSIPTGSISPKFDTRHPWLKGISFNEGPHSFPRGDNEKKNSKHVWRNFYIFFILTGPILFKDSKNQHLVKIIQVCSNGVPHLFPKEILMTKLKKLMVSSKTTGPISTKLDTNHSWVNGIQVCSNEGPHLFTRGDNYEIAKIHWRN